MRKVTTHCPLVATVVLAASGCAPHATFAPQPSPHADAVLIVRTSGPTAATATLRGDISDHVVTVDCTGRGHITFHAKLGDAAVEDTVACPSITTLPAVEVKAKGSVRLEITSSDGDADGFVELAPKQD